MQIQYHFSLKDHNTFGIAARAAQWVRVTSEEDVIALTQQPNWAMTPRWVLGGGSNLVITHDLPGLVIQVGIVGKKRVHETEQGIWLEVGAGETWHDVVTWSLEQGWFGLENLALIPGTVGGAIVQNIGAYGLELQDRLDGCEAIDLLQGKRLSLNAAQCGFGYRDSIFKHSPTDSLSMGLAGVALVTRVRLFLPKPWRAELHYLDLVRRVEQTGIKQPCAKQIFDWVVAIRKSKLPDPNEIGNAGSFFKNPTVTPEQCADIIARDPKLVHYPLPNGQIKLAAGWLIDACGWRGKTLGTAGVYDKQALVLVNRATSPQTCTGAAVMTLAKTIQTSVYERFGILLEPEPVIW